VTGKLTIDKHKFNIKQWTLQKYRAAGLWRFYLETLLINARRPINVEYELHMGRACSTNGEKRNAYRLLVGKPEGKSY
jgi:hypothetical protein